jgi:hypothetical protein
MAHFASVSITKQTTCENESAYFRMFRASGFLSPESREWRNGCLCLIMRERRKIIRKRGVFDFADGQLERISISDPRH